MGFSAWSRLARIGQRSPCLQPRAVEVCPDRELKFIHSRTSHLPRLETPVFCAANARPLLSSTHILTICTVAARPIPRLGSAQAPLALSWTLGQCATC